MGTPFEGRLKPTPLALATSSRDVFPLAFSVG